MTEHTAVPRTGFSTDGLSSHEGWEAWRNVFAPLFDIKEEADEPATFRADIDAFELPTMVVAQIAFGGVSQTGLRSKELIRRSDLDHYAIELCLESDGYLCEGRNGTAEIEAGSIVVLDLGQTTALKTTNSLSITLTIPRAILDRDCPGIENLHGIRMSGPGRHQLLRDHMLSLYRHLPSMTRAEAGLASEATVALVSACLAPSADRLAQASGIVEHTMLDRARRYIESRLDDPHLTPAAICAAVGVSRSNLYHLFRHSGGVAHYIQERRLRRANAALREPTEWRTISQLAYGYGFASAAHFSRAFRNLFGCSPRDIRDIARMRVMPSPGQAATGTFIEDWLKNLRSH
ncbi:helix-turn-helix domain-containing protein [Devosia ginsengisoli]|uniref:helix-turn-helix domain-containing protein n=1 Tax=Devosia ginsengisoli TaxID=400770 RepID=UPI00164622C5|nr:helix-turn-helix domain-containing protein [Devosia ginsengisoli]